MKDKKTEKTDKKLDLSDIDLKDLAAYAALMQGGLEAEKPSEEDKEEQEYQEGLGYLAEWQFKQRKLAENAAKNAPKK